MKAANWIKALKILKMRVLNSPLLPLFKELTVEIVHACKKTVPNILIIVAILADEIYSLPRRR